MPFQGTVGCCTHTWGVAPGDSRGLKAGGTKWTPTAPAGTNGLQAVVQLRPPKMSKPQKREAASGKIPNPSLHRREAGGGDLNSRESVKPFWTGSSLGQRPR